MDLHIKNLVVPQALLGLIEHWENSFSYSVADGIVGIGMRKLSNFVLGKCLSHVSPSDDKRITDHVTFIEALKSQGASTIGFHLYKDKKGREVGQLVLGSAENENKRFSGEIRWYTQSKPVEFWKLPVAQLMFVNAADGEATALTLNGGYTIPDPGTSLIAGPPTVIDKVNERLFRGMKLPKTEKKYGTIEFDCRYRDQLPTVVFVIQGRGYILEPKDYVKQFGNTCTSGFMAVEKLRILVLGDTFLRKYYAVFDYANEEMGLAEAIPPKMS